MDDLVNKVETVLFSSGKKVPLEELKRICKEKDEKAIRDAISELKKRHDDSTSLMVVEETDAWKMTIREKYLHLIRKIVTDTELTKTIMETLAVIAWKNPVLQSNIIKIRTNKAYDHISELKDSGFITSEKKGRTKLLKLTSKFYEYFDLKGDQDIKKVFGNAKNFKLPQQKVTDFESEKIEESQSEKMGTEEKVEVYGEADSDVEIYDTNDEVDKDLQIIDDNIEEKKKIQIVDEEPAIEIDNDIELHKEEN